MKPVIADLAMENELAREHIGPMEDEKLFCGGGRGDEPYPVGLHGTLLRAGSGSEGLGPVAVDVLPAALPACLACPPARRGPKTRYTDEQLTGEIRRTIQASPFHGEGHRKVWARLRLAGVRTSLRRVLRLMGQHALLAHQPQPQPVAPKRQEGTIVAGRPNQMWGIDATAGFTLRDGQVPIFAMIDYCSACCLGIHVARRGTRFEALEPMRQAVREQFGGFSEGIARGVKLRRDHGAQFMSDDFQREVRFLGLESSPAFVRKPEGNGCIVSFFGSFKQQF